MRSIAAGLLPLYGMCVAPSPSRRFTESAARCPSVPDPAEPKFCLRGSALAFATSSATLAPPSDGVPTSPSGVIPTRLSGAKSRLASYDRLGYTAGATPSGVDATNSVYPSFGAFAASAVPSVLPAPGLLSTSTCLPHCVVSRCASVRVMMSNPPPAAYGVMICTGRSGKPCAWTVELRRAATTTVATTNTCRFMAEPERRAGFRPGYLVFVGMTLPLTSRPAGGVGGFGTSVSRTKRPGGGGGGGGGADGLLSLAMAYFLLSIIRTSIGLFIDTSVGCLILPLSRSPK